MQDEEGYIVTLSEQLMGLEGGWGQRLESRTQGNSDAVTVMRGGAWKWHR